MKSRLTIRGARAADLSHVHPLIERAYRGETARRGWTHEADLLSGPRTSLDVLEGIVADRRRRLLVGWHGAVPVGCVAVADLGEARAYLGQLCVEPTLQAGGIGRRLIAAAENTARRAFHARAIEMTVIDTRTELVAWYVRRGYAETGERRDFPLDTSLPIRMTVLEKPLHGRTAA